MSKKNTIRVTLIADTEYNYISEGGQQMKSYLPQGTILDLPANWVYEPGLMVEHGEVKDKS